MKKKKAKLILEDGAQFEGTSFGYPISVSGEVVFNTGMTGYPETLTDPSYSGEILALTYPLIGNYGVPVVNRPEELLKKFESESIQIKCLLVSGYQESFEGWQDTQTLASWLYEQKIPALMDIDTRKLTQTIRKHGAMLGKVVIDSDVDFYDPNQCNLISGVSPKRAKIYGKGKHRVALLDCGCKANILNSLLQRNLEVYRLPWDSNLAEYDFDALLLSNGPGNPEQYNEPVQVAKYALQNNIPILGICLGHQMLSIAIGASTFKLKYGHRSQNQPVIDVLDQKCYISSQNHGFAVNNDDLPNEWKEWFRNLNDKTNEGIIHESGRFMSVQFHPEASPGPVDTGYIFDKFLKLFTNTK